MCVYYANQTQSYNYGIGTTFYFVMHFMVFKNRNFSFVLISYNIVGPVVFVNKNHGRSKAQTQEVFNIIL